jgi:uroporphyrinogen decarboxylase
MLHLHGENVMFDRFLDYPVQILNWHDQDTYPDLAEGQNLFSGVVCGGLKREKTLVLGSPQDVINEARQAIAATGGQRFILGTGCVAPIIAPRANLLAARQAVEGNL